MQEIRGVVQPFQGFRTRSGKSVRYPIPIQTDDGKVQEWTTFRSGTAGAAQRLVGKRVSAYVQTVPSRDGRYMNDQLEDIAAEGQLQPLAMPQEAGTPIEEFVPDVPVVDPRDRDNDRQESIRRQNATSTAFAFATAGLGTEFATLEEAKNYAKELTLEILNFTSEPQNRDTHAPDGPLSHNGTGESIVDAVNEAAGTEVVTKGPRW